MEENATETDTDRYYVDLQNEFFNVVPDKVHCVSCFLWTKSCLKPVETPKKITNFRIQSICQNYTLHNSHKVQKAYSTKVVYKGV